MVAPSWATERVYIWQVSVQVQGSLVLTQVFCVRCWRLQWWLWSICHRWCVDLRAFWFEVPWKCIGNVVKYLPYMWVAYGCCMLWYSCVFDASTSQYVSEWVCMCFMCNVGVKIRSVCVEVWTWWLCHESKSMRCIYGRWVCRCREAWCLPKCFMFVVCVFNDDCDRYVIVDVLICVFFDSRCRESVLEMW